MNGLDPREEVTGPGGGPEVGPLGHLLKGVGLR